MGKYCVFCGEETTLANSIEKTRNDFIAYQQMAAIACQRLSVLSYLADDDNISIEKLKTYIKRINVEVIDLQTNAKKREETFNFQRSLSSAR